MTALPVRLSDLLVWITLAVFLIAIGLEWTDRERPARTVGAAGWVAFGGFWLAMFPYFFFEFKSAIEGALSLAAVPACVYTGYLMYRGRDSLFSLTRAVTFMGLLYLPVMMVPPVRQWLIETTAAQTLAGMQVLGYDPGLVEGPVYGYRAKFGFEGFTTYIVLACTGIGSMAIFGGLIAAVEAPFRRKARAFATAVGIIWLLNLLRNVFIALASSQHWFDHGALEHVVTTYVGYPALKTSYFVSDRIVSQSLSVVALVGITWLVVRQVPEVLGILEEVLYVFTGTEYDLRSALGVTPGEDAPG